jgi:hypothetical protein
MGQVASVARSMENFPRIFSRSKRTRQIGVILQAKRSECVGNFVFEP